MIQIEKASQKDAGTLVKLNAHVHRLHVENAARFFKQPTEAETLTAMRDLLAQANTQAFIAYADIQAVGYVLFMIREQAENIFSPAVEIYRSNLCRSKMAQTWDWPPVDAKGFRGRKGIRHRRNGNRYLGLQRAGTGIF